MIKKYRLTKLFIKLNKQLYIYNFLNILIDEYNRSYKKPIKNLCSAFMIYQFIAVPDKK